MSNHFNAMGESLRPSDPQPRTKVRDVLVDVSSNMLLPSLQVGSARGGHFGMFVCLFVCPRA